MVSEKKINRIIKESIEEVMSGDAVMQSSVYRTFMKWVNAAQSAWDEVVNEMGSDANLVDKDGDMYALKGKIRLSTNGYLTIPFVSNGFVEHDVTKFKVFTRVGNKVQIYRDNWGDVYDYNDAKKVLRDIISDSKRAIGEMKEYDPNWEGGFDEPMDKKAIRGFNRKYGFRRDAHM